MSDALRDEIADSRDRYELEEEPEPHPLPTLPDLFSLFGAGLVVLVQHAPADPPARDYAAWLHIGENGRVTVCSGKAEVGQNIRTALAQAAADELCVPLSTVQVVLGDTDLTPFDMGTFGSRSTPFTAPQVRRSAAAARELLIDFAARVWGSARSGLTARSGQVVDTNTKRSAPYEALIKGRRHVHLVGQDTALKLPDQWEAAGIPASKKGGREFMTGGHRFTSDLAMEGMLFGKVLRRPAPNAALKSVNTSEAMAMGGVTVLGDGDFVGVAATTAARAEQALASICAEWDIPAASEKDLVSLLRPKPTVFPKRAPRATAHRLAATYTAAYIAHVPLEPRAALAVWDSGKLTVWTGTQRPFGVREELSATFGLPEQEVRVIVPDTGSGYGGKHTGEAAIEAARLARAAGKPVKLVWTREEEFTAAYLRPGAVIDVVASVRNDGTLAEWRFHNYNSGGSALASPYDVPSQYVEFHEVASPLRQGSYRALAATANNFARESHMDDLAQASGADPLPFRLKNLQDSRLRNVLIAAAERFGWEGRIKRPGHGFGIAGGTEKGSYIANCVEVAIDPAGEVKILRIVAAFECGAIVNPLHLENQVEGATVMGIGGALFEEIRYGEGKILNPRLSEYRVPRFGDVPEIEIALLDRKDLPSVGAGETPIIAIAPAVGNAICDAIGIRLRDMPLAPNGILRKASS